MQAASADPNDPAALRERLRQSEAECAALRKAMAERDAQLQDAHRDADDFQRAIGHDLRAPLRHVLAYSKLVREMQAEGEDPSAGLATLERSAGQLGRMVDGLVELARLGRASLSPCPVSAAALVAEARRHIAHTLSPADAARPVEWVVAADMPALIGDPVQLRLLWTQLLDNALKFTRPRAVARIEVLWLPAEGDRPAAWCVRDNGVGFDAARAGPLGRPFQRLHGATEFEGMGMGLALAQQVARRHGGSLQWDAVPGGGCTARLTLPGAPA